MNCAKSVWTDRERGVKGRRDRKKDVRCLKVWKSFLISLPVYSYICLLAKLNYTLTDYNSLYVHLSAPSSAPLGFTECGDCNTECKCTQTIRTDNKPIDEVLTT